MVYLLNMLQPEELSSRLSWAEEIARDAGRMMLEFASSGELGVVIKLDKTQVTEADKAINAMVIARARKAYPRDGVLGEEASENADRKLLWVCDPIDDTNGYILGMTSAMFSLALVEEGQPVVAVLYEPRLDRMFTATKGGGAFENGQPIRVTGQSLLSGAQVAYSPTYSQLIIRLAFYDSAVEAGVKLVPANGAAYKGILTATGMVDAFIFPGRGAHDVAALKLIVEEAGGKVTDLYGKEQRYDQKTYGAIVSNGRLHDQLVKLVQDFGPEKYVGY